MLLLGNLTVTVIQAEGVSYTRVHEYEYYVCVCVRVSLPQGYMTMWGLRVRII